MFVTLDDIARDESLRHDVSQLGGKALNCARLRGAGFPVPDGLVLPAASTEEQLAQLLDHPWFERYSPTQAFAVRSSAAAEDGIAYSFAGIHETVLDVPRERLHDAVGTCRQSADSEAARAYRRTHHLPIDGRTAVLIQPMVDAIVAGVAFTRHPVTGADELVIEAAPGLGEALVSGRVEPDQYRLSKPARHLIARHIVDERRGQPALDDRRLATLADLCLRVEEHYGTPQDLEWAADAHAVWLLQSRPITAAVSRDPEAAPAPPRTDAAAGTPHVELSVASPVDIEWTRANLAEVIPEQATPQALDAYDYLLNNGQRRFVGGLMAPEAEYGPPFKAFGGRLYFNLTQLCHVARLGGATPAAVKRSLGHSEGITPEDERVVRPSLSALIRVIPHGVRLAWLDRRAPQLVRQLDADNEKTIATLAAAIDRGEALDDRAIWATLDEWRHTGPERMVVILVHGSVMMIEEQLRKLLRTAGEDYDRFTYAQLATGEPSVSTRQAFDLLDLVAVARSEAVVVDYFRGSLDRAGFDDFRERLAGSAFLNNFDRFLERYGHRGLYESEWALPRYREDPTPLLFAIRTHVLNPAGESRAAITARLAREADEAWRALDARLSGWQRLVLKPRIRALVNRLKQRYIGREHCRSELVRVLYYARVLHLRLAERFVRRGWLGQRDDYFMLVTGEIEAVIAGRADPGGLRAIVTRRQAQRERESHLVMPLFMRQSEVAGILAGQPARSGLAMPRAGGSAGTVTELTGLCVSRGCVEAEVVVIRDPRDFAAMRRGAILVAPATDPSWTPLFTLAAGVIVEVGGILSHASTVAREYGLPALANVKHATTRLSTGDRVRLDASNGTVRLLPAR